MTTKASIGKRGLEERISRCVDKAIVVTERRREPRCLTFAIDHDKVVSRSHRSGGHAKGSAAKAIALREGAAAGHDFWGFQVGGIPR